MKKGLRNKFIIIGIVLLLILLVIFVISKIGNNSDVMTYKNFTILEGHSGKIDKYDPSNAVEGYKGGKEAYYISGKINSTQNQSFVLITFNLYDKKDNLLGTAVAGVRKLKKNQPYDFKAVSLIEYEKIKKIDHYKLESVK